MAAAFFAFSACEKKIDNFIPDKEVPEDGTVINRLIPESDNARFEIPSEQLCADGVFPDSSSPQWGSAVYPEEPVMQPLCAMLEFSLSSEKQYHVSAIRLEASGAEPVSGSFAMGYSNGAFNGEWVAAGGNGNALEISFSPELKITQESMKISLPVLAQSFAEGFSAKIYTASGHYSELKFYTEGKTLSAGETYTLPSFKFNPDASTVILDDYEENILFDSGLLKVGTYNILNDAGRSDCPDNPWGEAKSAVAAIIRNMDCDIMTINELSLSEFYWLRANSGDYEWLIKPNTANGISYSYAPGIIYKSSRLEKLSDGIFWLSDPEAAALITAASAYSYTDTSNGKLYSAGSNRVCLWAVFRDTHTGRKFCWFAPHPHIRGDDAASSLAGSISCLNAGNIRSLLKQIPYVNAESLPYIVAGDFNTCSSHVSYRDVLKKTSLVNAFEAAADAGTIDAQTATKPGTCPGKNSASYDHSESMRIDHIWYEGFNLKSYRQIYTKYNNRTLGEIYPSDHIPVMAVLTFN